MLRGVNQVNNEICIQPSPVLISHFCERCCMLVCVGNSRSYPVDHRLRNFLSVLPIRRSRCRVCPAHSSNSVSNGAALLPKPRVVAGQTMIVHRALQLGFLYLASRYLGFLLPIFIQTFAETKIALQRMEVCPYISLVHSCPTVWS